MGFAASVMCIDFFYLFVPGKIFPSLSTFNLMQDCFIIFPLKALSTLFSESNSTLSTITLEMV